MPENVRHIDLAAYRILLEFSKGALPISLLEISKAMGVIVLDLKNAGPLFDTIGIEGMNGSLAIALHYNGQKIIVVDYENTNVHLRRFLIAHELAHFILGYGLSDDHVRQIVQGVGKSPGEINCDLLAHRLLMPPTILNELPQMTTKQYAELCNVSPSMAYDGLDNFHQLINRDKTPYETFLDGRLKKHFSKFIDKKQNNKPCKKYSFVVTKKNGLHHFSMLEVSEELCG